MLKKIFKPKWEHKSPAVRKDGIKQLNPALDDQSGILCGLATTDPDMEVRLAAIGKLLDLEILDKLIGDADPAIQTAAQTRQVDLVCQHDSPWSEQQCLDILEDCSQSMLYRIAQNAENAHVKEQAFILLTDQQLLVKLASTNQSSKLRQMAVAGIIAEPELREVIENLKNKDKKAWQLAKSKLNQLKAENRQQRAVSAQQRALCDSIEQLVRGGYTLQFSGKYSLLRQQWQQLDDEVSASLEARFEAAAKQCQEIINAYQQEEQQRLEVQEEELRLRREQEAICDRLEAMLANTGLVTQLVEAQICTFSEQFNALRQQWQALLATHRAHPKEQMRFDKASHSLQDLLTAAQAMLQQHDTLQSLVATDVETLDFDKLLKAHKRLRSKLQSLNWPEDVAVPTLLRDAKSRLQQMHENIESLQAQQHQIKHNIDMQLAELEKNLGEGEIHHAHSVRDRIHQNLEKLAANDKRHFSRQLHLLEKQMYEFDDWKQFATEPKRIELCEEMEKLIDVQIPPKQKAQAIKELQEQWKALGSSRHAQKIWRRFKSAADKAYEPCKEFFQVQSQLRNHNYVQRLEICSQLETFLAQTPWDNENLVDWKVAENLFSVAKQEWAKFAPVDRAKAKALQDRFNKLLDELRDKLRSERKKNAEKKQAIIDEAKALLSHEDLQQAVDGAKQLQNQWKNIGITYRKDNQRLWKEFRAQCDAIFERRNQERDAEEHEKEENLLTAHELAQRIRELADQEDEALAQSQGRFNELKEAYYELGPVPKQHYQESKSRFQAATDYYQQRFSGIKARQAEQALDELAALADICDQLDKLGDGAEQQAIEALTALWQRPQHFDDEWWQKINKRFTSSLNPDSELKVRNSEHRKRICIRLEILAGLKSPADDSELRMQLQMDRLSKGLGQEQHENDQQVARSLFIDWYITGPNLADSEQVLKGRFEAARRALSDRST